MTAFEIAIYLGSLALAGAGVAYVVHLVRTSGRDRGDDPERARRVVETAPYERLDNLLAK